MDVNLVRIIEQFGSEERCFDYLVSLRWPDGPTCPHCQSKKAYRIRKRKQFKCGECKKQYSPLAGTVFNDSHLPLVKWFLGVYAMCESKKGISALQLKRMLGVGYKTAWYLCHRVRAAMANGHQRQLTGEVEIDETYLGPRGRGGPSGRGAWKKTAIIGMAERGGEIRWAPVKDVSRATILQLVEKHVSPQALALYSDEFPAYKKVAKKFPVKHYRVKHSESWVHGKVHTNTVESAWSLLKRSIVGSYHKVSKKHLPAYMEEVAYRYNNRKNGRLFQMTIRRLLTTGAIPFEKLTRHR